MIIIIHAVCLTFSFFYIWYASSLGRLNVTARCHRLKAYGVYCLVHATVFCFVRLSLTHTQRQTAYTLRIDEKYRVSRPHSLIRNSKDDTMKTMSNTRGSDHQLLNEMITKRFETQEKKEEQKLNAICLCLCLCFCSCVFRHFISHRMRIKKTWRFFFWDSQIYFNWFCFNRYVVIKTNK